MIEPPPPAAPFNRNAIVSITAAVLTVVSLCTAVAPIPLTGWVCYPAATILGLVALVTGILALAQISTTKENGRRYALAGVWTGAAALASSACTVAVGIAMYPRVIALIEQFWK